MCIEGPRRASCREYREKRSECERQNNESGGRNIGGKLEIFIHLLVFINFNELAAEICQCGL
jgi:hypothetical protein